MSDDLPPKILPEDEDEALAAELALGLIDEDEAPHIAARLTADQDFARRVAAWQERFAGLADELVPVMPPARARQRIREELGHASAPLTHPIDSRIRWWQRPFALIGAAVAVVALAAVLMMPAVRDSQKAAPVYQAQLASDDAAMQVAARLDGRNIEVMLQSGTVPDGRDWEIWWIKPDGSAPVSLGLVARQGAMRLTLPEGLEVVDGIRIALSDEPVGGSPTGQATGPILAIAPLTPS
ncbi:anti-sigma factor [Paracoccus aestuariivivens]|uniref:Anti-sigma K factor RskA C-terminal domain-containing protein n=1 Tax=Paracoccus aestuariivivens TaxID=1820333 RepID=A0A6L6J2Q2_9RHOB|nr:anti-sigma factor [Paracoccus aestuariivivens]MTH76200.1 hypothetical protein [Paracoccus aestuariivivens]